MKANKDSDEVLAWVAERGGTVTIGMLETTFPDARRDMLQRQMRKLTEAGGAAVVSTGRAWHIGSVAAMANHKPERVKATRPVVVEKPKERPGRPSHQIENAALIGELLEVIGTIDNNGVLLRGEDGRTWKAYRL